MYRKSVNKNLVDTVSAAPNVLLLYTDQQRYDSLGCNGSAWADTPNSDRLAYQGTVFPHYFVQSPLCMPSRISFLTGRYCGATGAGSNGVRFPEHETCVAELFASYGYATANIGKLHLIPHANRDHTALHPAFGFDYRLISDEPGCYEDPYLAWVRAKDPAALPYVTTSLPPESKAYGHPELSQRGREVHEIAVWETDENLSHSAFVADRTIDYLSRFRQTDQPFFAIAGFYAPHTPINPPQSCLDRVVRDAVPGRLRGDNYEHGGLGPQPDYLTDVSEEQWRDIAWHYHALVTHVDDQIGKILQFLRQAGLDRNTIVVLCSDHGEYLGDYGRIQKGMPGQDSVTRVPLIVYDPRPGQRTLVDPERSFVEAVDVMPTLLDMCGLPVAATMQGQSLLRRPNKTSALTEYFEPQGYAAATIRTEGYRYYRDSSGREYLFDLVNDPGALRNLAGSQPAKSALSDHRALLLDRLLASALVGPAKTAAY